MTNRASTVQTLDPLGALSGRLLTVIAGLLGAATAIFLTLTHLDQIASPVLAVAALGMAGIACLVLARVTAPMRMPVRRSGAVSVLVAGVGAAVLAMAAGWGANGLVRDDWSPLLLGLLLVALSPFRPPRELLLLGILTAAVVATLTIAQLPFFTAGLPGAVIVTIAVLPVLALALGGAAFSFSVLAYLTRWRRDARAASALEADAMHEGIVRAVQQGRVLILNQNVVPLFTRLVERGRIDAEDIEEARRVATAIRNIMVAETQRSWLDGALLEPGQLVAIGDASRVEDPSGLLDRMDFEQRAALRAFVVALRERARARARDVRIRVSGELPEGELLLTVHTAAVDVDRILAPYVAVLRAVFQRVSVGYSFESVTVRFNYDVR